MTWSDRLTPAPHTFCFFLYPLLILCIFVGQWLRGRTGTRYMIAPSDKKQCCGTSDGIGPGLHSGNPLQHPHHQNISPLLHTSQGGYYARTTLASCQLYKNLMYLIYVCACGRPTSVSCTLTNIISFPPRVSYVQYLTKSGVRTVGNGVRWNGGRLEHSRCGLHARLWMRYWHDLLV